MKAAAAALLLLTGAGCAAVLPAAPRPAAPPEPPAELRACLAAPAGVPPPALPRTFEAVAAWAQRTEDLRAQTARIAAECRDRLGRLNRWMDDVRRGG
jgi:hypothetical protein